MIDYYFVRIFSLTLTVFGIIGNSLVFYVLTRPKFIKESIFRYFLVSEIAASSTIVLLWMYYMPIILNLSISTDYCKIFTWLLYVAYNFYPWMNVLNSIDRLITLKYRYRFKYMKKFKYQILAIMAVLFAIIFTSLPTLINIKKSNETWCIVDDIQVGLYIYLSNMLISNLIPFFLLALSTCLIVHYLKTQKRRLQLNVKNYKREKDYIKTLFAMDICFFICYSPLCVMQFLMFVFEIDYLKNDTLNFVFDLTIALAMVQNSCNFLVYFSSNKLFKRYFISMIELCRRTESNNQVSIILGNSYYN
jgi:hypothetical protein